MPYELTVKPEVSQDYILWPFIEVKRCLRVISDIRVCVYSMQIPPEFHFEILFMESCCVPFMGLLVVRKVRTTTKEVVQKPYLQHCLYGFGKIYFDTRRILKNIQL